MSQLKDTLSATRANLFVGRTAERRHLQQWLQSAEARTSVFSYSGMGGIGKSALMSEMLRESRSWGIPGVWLDGRACTHTPTGFIDHLVTSMAVEGLATTSTTEALNMLFHASAQQKMVLCIDNFESLAAIEGWLLEAFLPRISDTGILLIVASRQGLSLAWKRDPAWRSRVIEMPLPPFSRTESLMYLSRFEGMQPERSQWIIRQTNGHPLALALVAEAAHRVEERVDSKAVSATVSSQLLRELVAPELQDAMDVLTVTGVCDQHVLSNVLNDRLSASDYHALSELSFVHITPNGLALHDVARLHLLADLQLRNVHRLSTLRDRIAQVLGTAMKTASKLQQRALAGQLLTVGLDAIPIRSSYADLSVSPQSFDLDVYRSGDLPRLHKILSNWCTYSVDEHQSPTYHAFLDELASLFPQTIQVIRHRDGEVMAMFILMMVYDDTTRLLGRYFMPELLECYHPDELHKSPDDADSYYAVLGAFDTDTTEYTGAELIGAFVRDSLSVLGAGTRVSLVLTNEALRQLLAQLGFQFRYTALGVGDTSYAKAEVAELDLRTVDFAKWVHSLLPPSPHDSQPPSRQMDHPWSVPHDWVKKALLGLRSELKIERGNLAKALHWRGHELKQYLMSILTGDRTVGLSPEQRKLLYLTYCEDTSATAAARLLNMSRATYYRHLASAIGCIAGALEAERFRIATKSPISD